MDETQVTGRGFGAFRAFFAVSCWGDARVEPHDFRDGCRALPAQEAADGLARIAQRLKRDSSRMEQFLHFGVSEW
jgi:hypothetical protein